MSKRFLLSAVIAWTMCVPPTLAGQKVLLAEGLTVEKPDGWLLVPPSTEGQQTVWPGRNIASFYRKSPGSRDNLIVGFTMYEFPKAPMPLDEKASRAAGSIVLQTVARRLQEEHGPADIERLTINGREYCRVRAKISYPEQEVVAEEWVTLVSGIQKALCIVFVAQEPILLNEAERVRGILASLAEE